MLPGTPVSNETCLHRLVTRVNEKKLLLKPGDSEKMDVLGLAKVNYENAWEKAHCHPTAVLVFPVFNHLHFISFIHPFPKRISFLVIGVYNYKMWAR
jgi:hypothetical protein